MKRRDTRQVSGEDSGRSGTAGRRGSAIIIAIGTLALISILASVYLVIGQADQLTARTVRSAQSTEGIEQIHADYFLKIFEDDRVRDAEVRAVGPTNSGQPPQGFFREVTDIPWIDYQMRSSTALPALSTGNDLDVFRFRPSGGHIAIGTTDESRQRVAVDPWLADGEPTWVGFDFAQDTLGANTGRLFSVNDGGLIDPELSYLENRGWRKISNTSPDGRFVNLWNLRNNWELLPGFGDNDPNDNSGNGSSDVLTLLEFQSDGTLRATRELPFDMGQIDDTIRNRPAHFTMFQRGMLIPMNQRFAILGLDNNIATWADASFADYQYADADGDGLADSRWQELVDATIEDEIRWLLPQGEYRWFYAARIIDLSGRVNVHTASDSSVAPTTDAPPGVTPGSIDLRGILSMSYAADLYLPPPGDLSVNGDPGEDAEERLSPRFTELPNDPAIRSNPNGGVPNFPVADDFREYRLALAPISEQRANPVIPDALSDEGVGSGSNDGGSARGRLIGAMAYDALVRATNENLTFPLGDLAGGPDLNYPNATGPREQTIFTGGLSASEALTDLSPFEPNVRVFNYDQGEFADEALVDPTAFAPDLNYYGRSGNFDIERDSALAVRDFYLSRSAALVSESVAAGFVDDDDLPNPAFGLSPFGEQSLAELLTYGGVNDDSVLSPLERVMAGRYNRQGFGQATPDLPGATTRSDRNLSPLMSSRPTDLGRFQHDDSTIDGSTFATAWSTEFEPDGIVDAETLAERALSVRNRITTISGAVPLQQRRLPVDASDTTRLTSDAFDLRLTSRDLKPELLDLGPDTDADNRTRLSIRTAPGWFDVAAQALAPGLFMFDTNEFTDTTDLTQTIDRVGVEEAWDELSSIAQNSQPLQSMFYGHVGPELPLWLAASWSLNVVDAADSDSEPTPSVLYLDNAIRGQTGAQQPFGDYGGSGPNAGDAQERRNPWGVAKLGTNTGSNIPTARLDLDDTVTTDLEGENLADGQLTGSDISSRSAAVMYGVEPHPILTEVAVWNVWTDSNDERTGRQTPSWARLTAHPGSEPSEYDPLDEGEDSEDAGVNIDVRINRENPDNLLHLIAFQIHNPFDVDVRLGVDARDTDDDITTEPELYGVEYYVEYAGRFFALAQYIEADDGENPDTGNNEIFEPTVRGVTLEPGETRVFYVPFGEIGNYRSDDGGTPGDTSDDSEQLIANPDPHLIERKWLDAFALNPDEDGFMDVPAREIIEDELTVFTPFDADDSDDDYREFPPYQTFEFDITSVGELEKFINLDANQNFLTPASDLPNSRLENPGLARPDDFQTNREFRLWRSVILNNDPDNDPDDLAPSGDSNDPRENDNTGEPPSSEYQALWWENDLLVDRLRDPYAVDAAGLDAIARTPVEGAASPSAGAEANLAEGEFSAGTALTRAFHPFVNEFNVTDLDGLIYIETGSPPDHINDSPDGMVFTRWASIRRGDSGVTADFGVPAWMLEAWDGSTNDVLPRVPVYSSGADPSEIDLSVLPDFPDRGPYRPVYRLTAGGQVPPVGSQVEFTNDDTTSTFQEENPYFGRTLDDWMDHLRDDEYSQQNGSGGNIRVQLMPSISTARGETVNFRDLDPFVESGSEEEEGIYWDDENFKDVAGNVGTIVARPYVLRDLNGRRANGSTLRDGLSPGQIPLVLSSDDRQFANEVDGPDDGAGTGGGRLRLLDLLAQLPVGPVYTPSNATNAREMYEWHWMTLGESLAAALGYQPERFYYRDPSANNLEFDLVHSTQMDYSITDRSNTGNEVYPFTPLSHLWYNFTPNNPGQSYWHSRLDNGQLAFDNYVAFINRDAATEEFDGLSPIYSPDPNGGDGDYRVGNGLPMAVNLLSDFTTLRYPVYPVGDAGIGDDTPDDPRLTTPIAGTINLNTADKITMRALPEMTPLMSSDMQGDRLWWPQRLLDLDVIDPVRAINPENGNDLPGFNNPSISVADAFGLPDPFGYQYIGPEASVDEDSTVRFFDPRNGTTIQNFNRFDLYWANVRDVAASVLAYRDAGVYEPRPLSIPDAGVRGIISTASNRAGYGLSTATPQFTTDGISMEQSRGYPLDFRPTTMKDSAPTSADLLDALESNLSLDRGRTQVNGVWGIRNEPGFIAAAETISATLKTDRIAQEWDKRSTSRILPNEPGGWAGQAAVLESTQFLPDGLGRDYYDPRSLIQSTQNATSQASPSADEMRLIRDPDRQLALRVAPVEEDANSGIKDRDFGDWGFSMTGAVATSTDSDGATAIESGNVYLDSTPNDHRERLALVNSIAASADVRSDYFAAWFIVRGYRESDVTDLAEEDPMYPTYERRFMMVIDRSNVLQPGDKPKVVLFREVPL